MIEIEIWVMKTIFLFTYHNLSFQSIMEKVWNKLVHIDLPIFSLGDKKSTDKYYFWGKFNKKEKKGKIPINQCKCAIDYLCKAYGEKTIIQFLKE